MFLQPRHLQVSHVVIELTVGHHKVWSLGTFLWSTVYKGCRGNQSSGSNRKMEEHRYKYIHRDFKSILFFFAEVDQDGNSLVVLI